MLTVKNYLEYRKNYLQDLQSKCDEWLMEEVFPYFKGEEWVVNKPSWTSVEDLKMLLEQRGWVVGTCSNYLGSYLYLSLPPNKEES
jgi:hypothetical protein